MIRLILAVGLLTLLYSCDPSDIEEETFEDVCDLLKDTTPITSEERENTCNYIDVYQYQGDLYSLCMCCSCFKAVIPINCSGEPLYTPVDPKFLETFKEEAEFLYSAISN